MWIGKFLEYLKVEKRYSSLTVLAYENDLEQFSEFLEQEDLTKVNSRDVRSYLSSLVSLGLAESTINRKLSSIKSFYKFLLELEEINKLPTIGIRNLKSNPTIFIPFSQDEMLALVDLYNIIDNDFEALRDQLIVELLYTTGMRRAELLGLKWEDIDVSNSELKVLGKGGKQRLVPISQSIMLSISHYKEIVIEKFDSLPEKLFITSKGKNLYPKLVYNIVKSYLSLVSVKKKKSPHMLRHSFATHMLNNGAEINAIKDLLGHSSLASTQIYTHSDISELKKIFKHNHPRNLK
ncbi:MAG: tyrosine-type recombinase/integrase [Weeksellaceae bacterium]